MGGGERRHRRRSLARRLARRSPDLRRAARRRDPVRGLLSRRRGGRLGSARGGQRIGGRAGRFRRAAARDDGARGAFVVAARAAWDCEPLRSFRWRSASPIRSRSPRRRRVTGCRSRRAFRPSFWPSRRRRLGGGAPRADRPDRRTEDPGALIPRIRALAREACRRQPRTILAPAPSAPISPPCGMKRNIRGCSDHDTTNSRCASASAARSAPARRR